MIALALKTLGVLGAWETAWWARRRLRRTSVFNQAQDEALFLHRPLVVIGAPDGGVTSGYGCGDLTIDVAPSACPAIRHYDITQHIPLADNSCVVFCSCVLEYVTDPQAAVNELNRISGGRMFFVGVEPWTLTAYLYPGAKQTLPSNLR